MQDFDLETIGPSGDRAVLRVAGEVDVYTAPQLRERLLDLAAKGVVHVIVDLSEVEFLDSTGLGALVGGLKRLRAHDGNLMLAIDTERILRVFRITGLTRVLKAHPSVRDAIAADPDWRQHVESEADSIDEWCRQRGLR